MEKEYTEDQYDKDYEQKQQGLEAVLGEMHDMVGHSVTPFYMGRSVDLYYFLNHIPGTGIATMELLDIEGNGPLPNELGTYELVAFTKEYYNHNYQVRNSCDLIASRICCNLTAIGNYSSKAVLKPGDTYQARFERETRYIIFDNYKPNNNEFKVGDRKHHLLVCMEIFESEMEFSGKNGSEELLDLLKKAGHYPYSDLNRRLVV